MRTGLLLILLVVSGCATQAPETAQHGSPGFLYGLLHGFLIFFSLVGSFFTDYEIYATPNNGWPYNLGFFLGGSVFFGGSARSAK